MTRTDILKLRPEFTIGGYRMIDWFEITEGGGQFSIRSGLRHADGETKTPFHYEKCLYGKNAKKESIKQFNNWWNNLNYNK